MPKGVKGFQKGNIGWNKGKKTGQVPWNKGTIQPRKERIEHNGYWHVRIPEHPYAETRGYVPEHRVVMERSIGRYIDRKVEHVHHVDKNKKNNDISNLMLLDPKSHKRLDLGWVLEDNVWYKLCTGCNRMLRVDETNFLKAHKAEWRSFCRTCCIRKNREYSRRRKPSQTE